MGEEDKNVQELPDRAEEKRVDVPQNETAAPVEETQADSAPTETAPAGGDAQPTQGESAQQ